MPESERDLRETASALGRWQGATEAQVRELSRRIDHLNAIVDVIERDVSAIKVDIAVIRTRTAFWSATGALVGGGAVSAVVAILTGGGS